MQREVLLLAESPHKLFAAVAALEHLVISAEVLLCRLLRCHHVIFRCEKHRIGVAARNRRRDPDPV